MARSVLNRGDQPHVVSPPSRDWGAEGFCDGGDRQTGPQLTLHICRVALLLFLIAPVMLLRTPVDIFPNINIPVVSIICN